MASGSQLTRGDRQTTHMQRVGTREISGTLCNCPAESTTATPIDQLNHVVEVDLHYDTHLRLSTAGWTLEELLRQGKRFHPVKRFPLKSAKKTIINFDETGIPCIIYGLHRHANWPEHYFKASWLKKHGPKEISVRNVYNSTDRTMLLDDFIEQSRRTASSSVSLKNKESLYGKDVKCPERWERQLRDTGLIPSFLLPGNDEDLLPPQHVDTFKCHIGIGDTFTRCHQDLCASSGHDLMCYTEGKASSFWFMTEGKDAPKASRYFEDLKRKNGHEDHALTVEQLAEAPFAIYVAEQKLGDLVLIPPRSCHQVVNFGGLTIKTSWSRMVLKGLEAAYYHELPMYRRVCWPEKYRIKWLIYLNLLKSREALASLMSKSKDQDPVTPQNKKILRSTEQLLKLFGSVLLEESPPRNRRLHCLQSSLPSDTPDSSNASSTITPQSACHFCGANIFQSFFECLKCISGSASLESSKVKHGEGIIICPGCYVEGRSCKCGNMDPIQCRPFQELLAVYNQVTESLSRHKANQILKYDDPLYNPTMRRTFRAACLLQNMREKSKGEERICSLGPSHVASLVLNCKKCHRGRCFPHILRSQKLHAADAILINSSNSLHEEGSFLQKYRKGEDHLLQTQQLGCKPDPTQQRVRLAEQYQRCRPVNPTSVQAGWYDVSVEVLASNTKTDRNITNVSQDSPLENVTRPLSSPTIFDSRSPLSELSDLTVSNAAMSTLKRKRQVLDFVSVPNRPYNTRVLQKRISGATGPDSGLSGVVSRVQRQHVSSSPAPNLDAVQVDRGERGQDQDMQVQSPGPPSVPAILRRDELTSQSSASGAMASSPNPGTSTSLAAKEKSTATRATQKPDVPAPPTPPRSPSTSTTTTKSSQTQQSHVPEGPARIDPESRQTLTDGSTVKRRKPTHNEESPRKRTIPEVPRRQFNSTASTVAGLAEALNTAAVSNHSAFCSADVDCLSNSASSNNNNVSEAGASAFTSAAKTPSAQTGPSRSSPAAFAIVRERDQDVMQIDSHRSPSIERHDHTQLQNPALLSSSSSPSETDFRHSTSINAERNTTATTPHGSTKRRLHPTSPIPAVSLSPSSTSARSTHPTKQLQTKVVTPTQRGDKQRGENNMRQANFSIPASPAPSPSTTIAPTSHQIAESRGDTRSRQPPPSGPTFCELETSSRHPLPAPSGVTASSSTATGSRSVHDVLDQRPPVPDSATPSKNNTVPDAAPLSTPIDENPLSDAVQELQRAIHDSQHIPSRVENAIVAFADAMNKLVAQHPQNPQNTHAISPTWSPASHPAMFQQPYTLSPLWWSSEYQRYQQLVSQLVSQDREMFPSRPIPSFDGEYPNSWPSTPYDHFPRQFSHYDDGSRMRSGYSYGHRRYQPYREDYERRPDNRNHSFTRPRYNQQDRPPRTMWSDNTHHRGYPSNQGYFNSQRRTYSSEGRSMDVNSPHADPVHPVRSSGGGSHPGGSDNRSSADKSMNRADSSPSSMTNQPRSSYSVDVASQPSAQQPGGVDSGQPSSHPAPPAELLPGRDRHPPIHLTSRESGCEQKETAIDDDLSQEEHLPSTNLKHSLYENPWAC